jgi:endosialidase-like protein
MKTTLLENKISIGPLPFKHIFVLIVGLGLTLAPVTRAVSPAPDGGYVNGNTAEGDFSLQSLTTGNSNTALGNRALFSNTTGSQNTATGRGALVHNTTGFQNVATGFDALFSNNSGFHNTATGIGALFSNTTGNHNTANGDLSLVSNMIGNFNTVVGAHALISNTNGSFNIALGVAAGEDLTGTNNIDISNGGVAAESNTIRIGNEVAFTDREGIMHAAHTRTFVAGVSGTTAVGGTAVFVDSSGQFGTVTSSARFKDHIKPMGNISEAILALKPVTFHYKKELDPAGISQFGLVAEDVEKVNPDLVIHDRDGKPYTVRYEVVNAMLLNEFLKEHNAFVEEQHRLQTLEAALRSVNNRLKEQEAKIERVSAQVEVSRKAPQIIADNQ